MAAPKNYLRVVSVQPGGEADRVGIKVGDVLVSYDSKPISNNAEFEQAMRQAAGPKIPVVVKKNLDNHRFYVASGSLGMRAVEENPGVTSGQQHRTAVTPPDRNSSRLASESNEDLWFQAAMSRPGAKQELERRQKQRSADDRPSVIPEAKLASYKQFLYVSHVESRGQGQSAGIRRGDIILAYDGQTVSSESDLDRAINLTLSNKPKAVIERAGEQGIANLEPGYIGIQTENISPQRRDELIRRAKSTGDDREIGLLDRYSKDLWDLVGKLDGSSGLVSELETETEIYAKNISQFVDKHPNDRRIFKHLAEIGIFRAYAELGSEGYEERMARETNDLGPLLFYSFVAKNQNSGKTRRAVKHLENSLRAEENPYVRLLKADLLFSVGKKNEALADVNKVLGDSPDDEIYYEAKKLKDRIEHSSSKKCYIATAVYGSPTAPEVMALRLFRDERLLTTSYGRLFVWLYYRSSPRVADVLGRSRFVSNLVKKWILGPIVTCIDKK